MAVKNPQEGKVEGEREVPQTSCRRAATLLLPLNILDSQNGPLPTANRAGSTSYPYNTSNPSPLVHQENKRTSGGNTSLDPTLNIKI